MINKNMLFGKMASAGFTQLKLSKETGIPISTLSSKINGHTAFNTVDIERIVTTLKNIKGHEVAEIFLPEKSQ